MDGRFTNNQESPTAEEAGTPSESDPSSAAAAESPKRSRRSLQKRVVMVPISEVDGTRPKGASGEGAPPSDSWAWRKYGQKPIKGSPYPRGYYRCSSSKGCPAKKQVERSREDPNMLVVTYASDHNHPWPLPKNSHGGGGGAAVAAAASKQSSPSLEEEVEEDLAGRINFIPPDCDPEERFSDLIGEEASRDYYWFSDVGSPSAASPPGSTDDLLLGSITEASADVALVFREECERCGGEDGEEEEEMFAGLGELPECSVVFRRSYQMMMEGEEGSWRCGLPPAAAAASR